MIYPLKEVLLLCLLAVLAGAETFTNIALFGEKKLVLLRRFLPFRDGTPLHDRLSSIFAALDAEMFQRCFVSWVAATAGVPAKVIAIDGKIARCSYKKKAANDAIHIVSAFAAEQRLVLGQTKVDEKSNEIIAIPKLRLHANATTTPRTRANIQQSAAPVAVADRLGPIVRSHWPIENSLHWVMDMVFRDDECRVREGNAAANFVTLKHIAHNLTRRAPGKTSIRARRKAAAWDDDYLVSLAIA